MKKRFVEKGLHLTLHGRNGERVYKKKVDGDLGAKIIAVSCSKAPEGFSQWSLRVLADRVVELGYMDDISHETVRQIQINELKTWKQKGGNPLTLPI